MNDWFNELLYWFSGLPDWFSGLLGIYEYTTADAAEDAEDSEENAIAAWKQAAIDSRYVKVSWR